MSNIKEIKRLRGDVACYVAQASAPIDAEIGQKDHFWMETSSLHLKMNCTLSDPISMVSNSLSMTISLATFPLTFGFDIPST